MELPPLGTLRPDEQIPEWLVSEPAPVPLLGDMSLSFRLVDVQADPRPEDFEEAVLAFLALGEADRRRVEPHVFALYRVSANEFEEDEDWDWRVAEPAGIWPHVHPEDVSVSRRPYGDRSVYVAVEANCEWEEEHGLQLVYRCGHTLSRVSTQDGWVSGADAYDLDAEPPLPGAEGG